MGSMKTEPKDIRGKRIAERTGGEVGPMAPATEPTAALMARDLAAWRLAQSAIAKARGASGT